MLVPSIELKRVPRYQNCFLGFGRTKLLRLDRIEGYFANCATSTRRVWRKNNAVIKDVRSPCFSSVDGVEWVRRPSRAAERRPSLWSRLDEKELIVIRLRSPQWEMAPLRPHRVRRVWRNRFVGPLRVRAWFLPARCSPGSKPSGLGVRCCVTVCAASKLPGSLVADELALNSRELGREFMRARLFVSGLETRWADWTAAHSSGRR